jgi:hypothetical protein
VRVKAYLPWTMLLEFLNVVLLVCQGGGISFSSGTCVDMLR